MSNRDLMSPNRALEQVISALNRELEQIAKRIRWSSSTGTDADAGAQTVTVSNSGAGPVTLTTIASFTVDSGRWLLLGNSTIRALDGVGALEGRAGLEIHSPTTKLDEDYQNVFYDSGVDYDKALACAATINLSVPTLISLKAYLDAPTGTNPTSEAVFTRLSAAPA